MTAVNTEEPVKGTRRPGAPDALLGELSDALRRVRRGELDVRLPRRDGLAGEVVDQFNELVALQERRNRDLLRIRACPTDHGTGSRSQILIEATSMVPRKM